MATEPASWNAHRDRQPTPTCEPWTRTKVAEAFGDTGELGKGYDNIAMVVNADIAAAYEKGHADAYEEIRRSHTD